ncbi:hypothetical protein [Falsibacillus pallidus]|uniref:Uncharacterized protein n=1 Tax=Falsibacillus pallidus TaxID=493781 RepID=A0A370GPD4_9BACI|nr:hypothetical protein [Falsibacillus pallidus]RDI45602.1 hypothetical protein DFR59_102231 [Falsibacillus pallidus]
MKWEWIGLGMCVIYGVLTIAACLVQMKEKKIPLSSSIILGLIGASIIGLSFFYRTFFGMATLISCFIAIHFLAMLNGFHMYGKINIKHHIIRLIAGACILILLFYL